MSNQQLSPVRSVFPLDVLAYAVATLLAVATAILLAFHFSDIPEVYVSHTTNKCVEVRDPASQATGRESEWSCTNLPPRYEQVWTY